MKPIVHTGKRTIASIILAFGLTSVPAHAGLPVIDWTGIITTTKQTIQDLAQWKMQFDQWKTQFQELVRGSLSGVSSVKMNNGSWSEAEYENQIKEIRDNCSKISNTKSQTLCVGMADVQLEKNKLFFKSFKEINAELDQLLKLIDERNKLNSGTNNSGEKQTKENEIIIQGQHVDHITQAYDQKLKQLDTQYEMMRKARVEEARKQMTGSDLGNALVKSTIAVTLDAKASDWRSDAADLKTKNTNISNQDIITRRK